MPAFTAYLRRHHWGMLACAMSMAGTAYAAELLPPRSVGSEQLRKGAVTPSKLSQATVRKLAGRTDAPDVAGPAGPAGPAGATGPAGPVGATATDAERFDGLDTVVVVKQVPEITLASGSGTSRNVFCDADGVLLNASHVVNASSGPAPDTSRTQGHRSAAQLQFFNPAAETSTFTATVTLRCLVAPAP